MNQRSGTKVLHIITLFSIGGATENTLLSVEGLQELGYDVQILTGPNIGSEGSMFEQARQHGVRVHVLAQLKRSIHPFYDSIAFFKILGFLRRGKFDIVHTHSSKAGFSDGWPRKLQAFLLLFTQFMASLSMITRAGSCAEFSFWPRE